MSKNKRSTGLHGYAFESSNMERAIKKLLEVECGNTHGDDRMLVDEEKSRRTCKVYVSPVEISFVMLSFSQSIASCVLLAQTMWKETPLNFVHDQ